MVKSGAEESINGSFRSGLLLNTWSPDHNSSITSELSRNAQPQNYLVQICILMRFPGIWKYWCLRPTLVQLNQTLKGGVQVSVVKKYFPVTLTFILYWEPLIWNRASQTVMCMWVIWVLLKSRFWVSRSGVETGSCIGDTSQVRCRPLTSGAVVLVRLWTRTSTSPEKLLEITFLSLIQT